jgi:hypothetical protein
MSALLFLDNAYFVLVQTIIRLLRMSYFVGANIFFGGMFVFLGFLALSPQGFAPPGGIVTCFFWFLGAVLIVATLVKGRDAHFVKKFVAELALRYRTPWHAPSRRILRVVAMTATLSAFFTEHEILLLGAFFLNGATSYAVALCLAEHEKEE